MNNSDIIILDSRSFASDALALTAFARAAGVFGADAPEVLLGMVERLIFESLEDIIPDAHRIACEKACSQGLGCFPAPAEFIRHEYVSPSHTTIGREWVAFDEGNERHGMQIGKGGNHDFERRFSFGTGRSAAVLCECLNTEGEWSYTVDVGYRVERVHSLDDLASTLESMRIRVDARDTTTPTTTNDSDLITLDFDERETLRWADGALGVAPRQAALDRLANAGLVTTCDVDEKERWNSIVTNRGLDHLRSIGSRG